MEKRLPASILNEGGEKIKSFMHGRERGNRVLVRKNMKKNSENPLDGWEKLD